MFQAWLVKMGKIAAISAPSTRPGVSDRKKMMVIEEAQDRDRLQDVQQRHQDHLGAAALGGQVA